MPTNVHTIAQPLTMLMSQIENAKLVMQHVLCVMDQKKTTAYHAELTTGKMEQDASKSFQKANGVN